jgi:hypothetical protein
VSGRIKFLGINLTEEVKNCALKAALMSETKMMNDWQVSPSSWTGDLTVPT